MNGSISQSVYILANDVSSIDYQIQAITHGIITIEITASSSTHIDIVQKDINVQLDGLKRQYHINHFYDLNDTNKYMKYKIFLLVYHQLILKIHYYYKLILMHI